MDNSILFYRSANALMEAATNLKLCYIDENELDLHGMMTAYFTENPLKSSGDDWDDAPYEHNAGPPIQRVEGKGKIVKLIFSAPGMSTPAMVTRERGFLNSPYSVEDIIHKDVPWLSREFYTENAKIEIFAGVDFKDFLAIVILLGGIAYLSEED